MIIGRCKFISAWPNWDSATHEDKAQIARQGWAMTYPFTFDVNVENNAARFSSTSDLPYYDTTLTNCDCYDFQDRRLPCKHIYRLAVELGIIEIIKRPSFDKDKVTEVKESFDMDSHPEQIKRITSAKKAETAPAMIDIENKTAEFKGSGKKPYITTLDSCTCRDFFVRKLPCKHIYRLRFELNDTDFQQVTDS